MSKQRQGNPCTGRCGIWCSCPQRPQQAERPRQSQPDLLQEVLVRESEERQLVVSLSQLHVSNNAHRRRQRSHQGATQRIPQRGRNVQRDGHHRRHRSARSETRSSSRNNNKPLRRRNAVSEPRKTSCNDTTPHQRDQQQVAQYSRQVTQYSRQDAQYSRQVTQYSRQDAQYSRQVTQYSRQDAQYSRQVAQYSHQDAQYSRQIAQYSRQDAQYSRQDAQYSRQVAQYSHQDAQYSRQDAQYSRQDAQYSRQDAQYSHQDAQYSRQIVQYSRQVAQYSHQDAQYSRQIAQYSGQYAQYSRQDAQYSRQDAQYSRQFSQYSRQDAQYSHQDVLLFDLNVLERDIKEVQESNFYDYRRRMRNWHRNGYRSIEIIPLPDRREAPVRSIRVAEIETSPVIQRNFFRNLLRRMCGNITTHGRAVNSATRNYLRNAVQEILASPFCCTNRHRAMQRATPRRLLRDDKNIRRARQVPIQELPQWAPRRAPRQVPRRSHQQAVRRVGQRAPRKAPQQVPREAPQQEPKQEAQLAVEEAPEQAPEMVAEQAVEEAPEQVPEAAPEHQARRDSLSAPGPSGVNRASTSAAEKSQLVRSVTSDEIKRIMRDPDQVQAFINKAKFIHVLDGADDEEEAPLARAGPRPRVNGAVMAPPPTFSQRPRQVYVISMYNASNVRNPRINNALQLAIAEGNAGNVQRELGPDFAWALVPADELAESLETSLRINREDPERPHNPICLLVKETLQLFRVPLLVDPPPTIRIEELDQDQDMNQVQNQVQNQGQNQAQNQPPPVRSYIWTVINLRDANIVYSGRLTD